MRIKLRILGLHIFQVSVGGFFFFFKAIGNFKSFKYLLGGLVLNLDGILFLGDYKLQGLLTINSRAMQMPFFGF